MATTANTGLSISRNKNKFTAKWKQKIKADDIEWQKFKYRVYNGKKWGNWHEVKLGAKTTEKSISLSPSKKIHRIQIAVQIKKKKENPSKWTVETYKVEKPPTPTLTVTNNSANQTTFAWTIDSSDTNHHWYYRCMYRTKCTANPKSSSGWSSWAHASSASYTYTDNILGKTRVFEIKAVGAKGESKTRNKRHVINTAPRATWAKKKPVVKSKRSSYYKLTYNFNLSGSTNTVDSIVPQYTICDPDANMEPTGAWTDGTAYNYANGKKKYTLAANTGSLIGFDECLWARIKTVHDSQDSFSEAYRVITGRLKAPTCTITMGTPLATGFSVTVSVDDVVSDVVGIYQQVFLEKYSAMGVKNYILIGTIPSGTTSAVLTSTEDLTTETGYAIHVRNITADGKSMTSAYYTYKTSMPVAPTLNSVKPTTTTGKVLVNWTNNWTDATGVIISWTDDPDNWTSNEEPEQYEITEPASEWYIKGLSTGVTWHFRVRSVLTLNDSVTYSQWSDDIEIDLAEAPAVPVLYLSEEAITENGMVTAYWSYVTTDGTAQVSGNVVSCTYSGGAWTYGNPVDGGSTSDAQHVDIYAEKNGWTSGTTVYLALQTQSASGGVSEYSTPVQLDIAPEPTVSITNPFTTTETVTQYFTGDGATTDFVCANDLSASPTVTVDGVATAATYSDDTVTISPAPDSDAEIAVTYSTTDNNVLTVLSESTPLTVTVATTSAEEVTLAIERKEAYPVERPDGEFTDGAAGETIYVSTIAADATNTFTIEPDDLIGRLDDGALYNLVATVKDSYGQTSDPAVIPFTVNWAHQAWYPSVLFVTDFDKMVVKITPQTNVNYAAGDTCDIYRLGADKPELIYSGAQFGTMYVDPFPSFGEHSGYRVVTVTANKDYITDNAFAMYDTIESGNYPQLDSEMMVIDFGARQIKLPYNITLNNSWEKDFKRTVYLGGHITGDHNRAVTRDLSASTVVARDLDEDKVVVMRELARYAGVCHVRTPDGSSFAADVQVSEDRGHDMGTIEYSLTIQKVDTVGFDAMTYAEWSEAQ